MSDEENSSAAKRATSFLSRSRVLHEVLVTVSVAVFVFAIAVTSDTSSVYKDALDELDRISVAIPKISETQAEALTKYYRDNGTLSRLRKNGYDFQRVEFEMNFGDDTPMKKIFEYCQPVAAVSGYTNLRLSSFYIDETLAKPEFPLTLTFEEGTRRYNPGTRVFGTIRFPYSVSNAANGRPINSTPGIDGIASIGDHEDVSIDLTTVLRQHRLLGDRGALAYLHDVTDVVKAGTFGEARRNLARLASEQTTKARNSLQILGLSIPASLLVWVGPGVLLAMAVGLQVHLVETHATVMQSQVASIPWMALYPGKLAIGLTYCSIALPTIAVFALLVKSWAIAGPALILLLPLLSLPLIAYSGCNSAGLLKGLRMLVCSDSGELQNSRGSN